MWRRAMGNNATDGQADQAADNDHLLFYIRALKALTEGGGVAKSSPTLTRNEGGGGGATKKMQKKGLKKHRERCFSKKFQL